MAEPPKTIEETVAALEHRAVKTYKSRISTAKRLSRLNGRWNIALVAFATATTAASIGLLVNRDMYGKYGDTLMVVLAVLSLVVSLVVSSVNFGVRAKAMESNYKRIQQIACEVEDLRRQTAPQQEARIGELRREYLFAVDSSENHSEGDYALTFSAGARKGLRSALLKDRVMSFAPLLALLAPAVVLVPFVYWYMSGI